MALERIEGFVPLSYQRRDWSERDLRYLSLPSALDLVELEAGESVELTLAPRRESMTAKKQTALLRITNGEGAQVWLPVSTERH